MSINQLTPLVIAAPYPGRSGARPAYEPPAEEIKSERSTARAEPVQGVIELVDATAADRQDSRAKRGPDPLMPGRVLEQGPRTMPGPRMLEALIVRMGGAGVNSGPGQLLSLSV